MNKWITDHVSGTRLTGIEYVVLGTAFGELKVVLTQLALQRTGNDKDNKGATLHQLSSMELIVYTSPIGFLVLFGGFLTFEYTQLTTSDAFLHKSNELLGLVLIGTFIVFILVSLSLLSTYVYLYLSFYAAHLSYVYMYLSLYMAHLSYIHIYVYN